MRVLFHVKSSHCSENIYIDDDNDDDDDDDDDDDGE